MKNLIFKIQYNLFIIHKFKILAKNHLDNVERTWLCSMCIWHLRNRETEGKIHAILAKLDYLENIFGGPSTQTEIRKNVYLLCKRYNFKNNALIEYISTHKITIYSQNDKITLEVVHDDINTRISYNQSLFKD